MFGLNRRPGGSRPPVPPQGVFDPLTPLLWIIVWIAVLGTGCSHPPADTATSVLPLVHVETATPIPIPSATPTATAPPTAVPTARPVAALPEMRLDVELFYAERWMRVRETVDLTNTSGDSWDEVVFNVPIDHLEGTFYLDTVSVTVGESSGDALPPFAPPQTALRVPLPRTAAPGEAVHVEMRYRVVIPPVGPTDWPPTGTTGWTFDLIQAGEWYPSLVPYVPGEGWHTWAYREVGDPTVYPLVNADLTVRTQPGVVVASGGPEGQDTDGAWHFHVDRARGIAFLASDRYQTVDGEADGVPIHSVFLPEHAAAGQAAADIAGQAIRLFDELYGPYPYDSLTVAENGFFGGMEYSALISITDYAYLVYPGEPPSLLHALAAHETAHQWWYGAVGNDQPDAPWLDEITGVLQRATVLRTLRSRSDRLVVGEACRPVRAGGAGRRQHLQLRRQQPLHRVDVWAGGALPARPAQPDGR